RGRHRAGGRPGDRGAASAGDAHGNPTPGVAASAAAGTTGLVSRHAAPGLEAPAATDVRGSGGTDRPARPGTDRHRPPGRPAQRRGPRVAARGGTPVGRAGHTREPRLTHVYPAAMDASSPSERRRLVVALDGPGSSGKSSVGAAAALRLGYGFCD